MDASTKLYIGHVSLREEDEFGTVLYHTDFQVPGFGLCTTFEERRELICQPARKIPDYENGTLALYDVVNELMRCLPSGWRKIETDRPDYVQYHFFRNDDDPTLSVFWHDCPRGGVTLRVYHAGIFTKQMLIFGE